MKTTKLLSLILILFVFSFQSYSQNKPDSSVNSLKKGSWAIQFGIGNNLDLTAFNNYSVSIMTHLTNKSAIRIGVGGSVTDQSGPSTDGGNPGNYTNKDYGFQFEITFLYYFTRKSALNFFIGAGPLGTYSYSETNRPYSEGYDYNKSTSWGLGAKGLAGCEWFFMRKASLFAEYEASITFGKTNMFSESVDLSVPIDIRNSTESNDIFVRGNAAKMGLSIYF